MPNRSRATRKAFTRWRNDVTWCMFKRLGWDDLLLGVIVGAGASFIAFNPAITGELLARLDVAATVILSGALVWVTWRYTRETTKMARASVDQVNATRAQLDLDLEPKLIGSIRLTATGDAGPEGRFVLVNLSRHSIWLEEFQVSPPQVAESPGLGMPDGDRDLQPGKLWATHLHDLADNQATIRVQFFYGPTAQRLHTRTWRIDSDGDNLTAVEATPES